MPEAMPMPAMPTPAKTVAIIQARMGSTRLPGKVLAEIAGHPMLWHVVQRARRAPLVDQVLVATSTAASDDALAAWCEQNFIPVVRGSEEDVLDRFYQAALQHGATTVVRITADCPLIDPQVLDKVIRRFQQGDVAYATNGIRYTYPDGLDTEVFSFAALEAAWRDASKPSEREHVTPYLRNGSFAIANVENETDLSPQNLRWTVDEPADLEFVRGVFAALAHKEFFTMSDVLAVTAESPELNLLKAGIAANEGYYKSLYAEAVAGAAPRRDVSKSLAWQARAAKVIPGASQTFSKGANQHVHGVAPVMLQRGKGCRVWDVDGNEYIDYIQGLLPNILGYADDEVNAAASAQLAEGHSFSLPHPLEVELAERLTRLIPCAEMVRFGKNGSDATSGAVRAARAYTKRERIACCGYHGWQDWYIGSTLRHAGVPQAVRELTHPFAYNDLAALRTVLSAHPGEFAAVIMEPFNFFQPDPGYLQSVKELAHQHGALLIFDEICSGFHLGLGGAQKKFAVTPDLACFGKAMGNGFPIAAVVGRADVMHTFEDIFFSFTFGGEVASMAACLKVLDILEHTDALARMASVGRTLQDGFNTLAKLAGLYPQLECIGEPVWALLKFRDGVGENAAETGGSDSLLTRSLFSQECVKRGVLLLVTHNLSAAHDHRAVEDTLRAYACVIKTLAVWLKDANPSRFLEGPAIAPVFKVR